MEVREERDTSTEREVWRRRKEGRGRSEDGGMGEK